VNYPWLEHEEIDPESPINELVSCLAAFLLGRTDLSEEELLAVKSRLVMHAERIAPGRLITLEDPGRNPAFCTPEEMMLVIVGKSTDGEPIVWHRPLPFDAAGFRH
jgi:hypothetical protein